VLSGFTPQEEKSLQTALENAGKAALCIITHGVGEASNRFNGAK
jgi:hypothetical protein